jgi:DNA-binding transcriptional regulator WhiA
MIRSSKTTKEVWENLEKTYEDKGLRQKSKLLRRLFCVNLDHPYKNST